jgi:antitoxin component YwqK of YwqJK toxin-antitoxin module
MICADTKVGLLADVALAEYYACGDLKRCVVKQKNAIELGCGTLIPQFWDDGKRKKLVKSVTFYESGNLESVILQDSTPVQTKLGCIPGEMITFYENGAIKRIFPSFGTISAFWTEVDEKNFSPEISLELPFGDFKGKAINLMFYETGDLKSMTLWPRDSMLIQTPAGKINTRIGFCLYPDGKIKSVEPLKPTPVSTPIGCVPAYDPDAIGIDGDNNSLVFTENGNVESLLVSTAILIVMEENEKTGVFAPSSKRSDYFDDAFALEPLKIGFAGKNICIGKKKDNDARAEYAISDCRFLIEPFDTKGFRNTCEECYE